MHLLSPTTQAWWEVLKWLPARSVLELSLVCREWRMATTSHRFVESHLVHANSIKIRPRIMFVMDATFGHIRDLDDLDDAPFPPNFACGVFYCSQPCHGLNVGTFNGTDFLCNPAIRHHQRIEHDDDDQQAEPFAGRIALGYDSDSEDHVLVFLAYDDKNLDTRDYKLRCNVRCLNGDIWWRCVEPPPRPPADVPPTYADGKIYWVVDPKLGPRLDTTCCELVAFDTVEEEFEVVEGPPCSHGGGRVSVVEFHDVVHVAWSDRDADAIDVWMMGDDGAWCVDYRIELAKYSPEYSSERTLLIGSDPTDGRILLNTGLSLGYYDTKTGELETVYRALGWPGHDDNVFCTLIYQESLLCPFMNQQSL
jgi:F-box interacting protein